MEGDGKYERISGSSLGGGTFWGLARLLTQAKDFDDVLEISMQGDNANVGAGGAGGALTVTGGEADGDDSQRPSECRLACVPHQITATPPPFPRVLQVDMLVGDIYGGRDYSTIGLSATTIASSFGKVISQVRVRPPLPPTHTYSEVTLCSETDVYG